VLATSVVVVVVVHRYQLCFEETKQFWVLLFMPPPYQIVHGLQISILSSILILY